MIGPDEWMAAAVTALAQDGVEGVKVEALARDLGVTKGSFYWHFTDRPALLAAILDRWEAGARGVLESASAQATAEQRAQTLFRGLLRPGTGLTDAEVFAWARRDRAVAERVWEIERIRVVFLKEQLATLGASPMDAHRRAEAAYLAAVAWLERSSRTPWMKADYHSFVSDILRLLLRAP